MILRKRRGKLRVYLSGAVELLAAILFVALMMVGILGFIWFLYQAIVEIESLYLFGLLAVPLVATVMFLRRSAR